MTIDFYRAIEALIVVAIIGIILMLIFGGSRNARLMQQCLADGHKEYECVGMLRGRR